jgi:hypothetical protein
MYFCMLFNKDQDDPTHSSFQILKKIIEGEDNLMSVKKTGTLYMGLQDGWKDDIVNQVQNPRKNQFIRKVIEISSKLQSMSEHCTKPHGLAHTYAAYSTRLNKTLDEFATFKSSATSEIKKYPSDPSKITQLNKRRRCLEGVLELVENGKMTSFDVFEDTWKKPINFHVFKKNQIGGVREILILEIEKRVNINIIETFAREICQQDTREMLTHGREKFSRLLSIQNKMMLNKGKNLIIHYNFDKTKWGPSFMPIQFLYMYTPFKKLYPDLFKMLTVSLINHSNKNCFYPDHLMKAWLKDLDGKYIHRGVNEKLQKYKEKFMRTREVSFINESNMGQGILHYISSQYHTCVLSLRDNVFKELCLRKNIPTGVWSDLVSSDDSYTCHSVPAQSPEMIESILHCMLQAQEVSERLMNVWTSKSKSSISAFVGEFNSCFISNLTTFPATLKFAISSVAPPSTDSFTRMVDDCYNSSRQLFENGGTLELYLIAQKLNRSYCETLYHTTTHNDPTKIFGITREHIPYQLGVFPIDHPELMLQFGPASWNMKILKSSLNEDERKLFRQAHNIISSDMLEDVADFQNPSDLMTSIRPINAITRVNKRLLRIRESSGADPIFLKKFIEENPLKLLLKPENIDEVKFKIQLKLFQRSAIDAMKMTDGSLYYGRVSASVSAKAFRVFGTDQDELKTYKECLESINLLPDPEVPMDVYYGRFKEYLIATDTNNQITEFHERDPLEIRTLNTYFLSEVSSKLVNPVSTVLSHFWLAENRIDSSQLIRDMQSLQSNSTLDHRDRGCKEFAFFATCICGLVPEINGLCHLFHLTE